MRRGQGSGRQIGGAGLDIEIGAVNGDNETIMGDWSGELK
jgi:hypothetical protein